MLGCMLRHFGEKLRSLRVQHHLSQTELAQRLALAQPSYISNLEAGRREPSLDLVIQIAELLEVATDYLLQDAVPVDEITSYPGQPFTPRTPMARHFGEKLRYLRTQVHLTQVDLAQQLSLSAHTHISYMESGRKDPSVELVLKIAEHFRVTTDYLLRDSVLLESTGNVPSRMLKPNTDN